MNAGSRRHSRYVDSLDSPLFPFGFGLSYTTFEYSNLRALSAPQTAGITVSVEVANTGERAGTTVAQCYVRDCVASVARPVRELKGFERVSLDAGEKKTIVFRLGPEELSYLDDNGKAVLEPGRFQVWVGEDSNAESGTEFELTAGWNVEGGKLTLLRPERLQGVDHRFIDFKVCRVVPPWPPSTSPSLRRSAKIQLLIKKFFCTPSLLAQRSGTPRKGTQQLGLRLPSQKTCSRRRHELAHSGAQTACRRHPCPCLLFGIVATGF